VLCTAVMAGSCGAPGAEAKGALGWNIAAMFPVCDRGASPGGNPSPGGGTTCPCPATPPATDAAWSS